MAKRNTTSKKMSDEAFDAFVEKTDFAEAVRDGKMIVGRRGRKRIGSKVTVTLPDALINRLKSAADRKAIAYQTLIRMIVAENIERYG